MEDVVKRPWYKRPGPLLGLIVLAVFAVRLLGLLHLALIGTVVPGESGRLTEDRTTTAGGEVVYFYRVDDKTYSGWRRGIDYGGQRLSIVHSPLVPGWHVTSTNPDLQTAWHLLGELDYWLRIALNGLGVLLGGLVVCVAIRRQ